MQFYRNSWRFQYLIHDNRTPVINKEKDLNNIIKQLHLTDTYRALHPTTTEYTFFSSIHGTFFRTDHVLGYKLSPSRLFKR